MNIYEVDDPLGEQLCKVYDLLYLVIEAMERIAEDDWSDHMDSLHRKVKQAHHYWEYVELKGEEE